jgi:hypothetical protein
VLAMKITSVDPSGTVFGLQFSFWSEDPSVTADQFVAGLGLVAPRTFVLAETGASQDVTGRLLPGAILPTSNLSQIIVASDVNGQLDPNGGDPVNGDGGFGSPFVSDVTEFLTPGHIWGLFAGDETPPQGGLFLDPRIAFYQTTFTPINGAIPPLVALTFLEAGGRGFPLDPEGPNDCTFEGVTIPPCISDVFVMRSTQPAAPNPPCSVNVQCHLEFFFWSENPNVSLFGPDSFSVTLGLSNALGNFEDESGHPPIVDELFRFPGFQQPSNFPFTTIQNDSDPGVGVPEASTFYLLGAGLSALRVAKAFRHRSASHRR